MTKSNTPYRRLLECFNIPTESHECSYLSVLSDALDVGLAQVSDSQRRSNRLSNLDAKIKTELRVMGISDDALRLSMIHPDIRKRLKTVGINPDYIFTGEGEPFLQGWRKAEMLARPPVKMAKKTINPFQDKVGESIIPSHL